MSTKLKIGILLKSNEITLAEYEMLEKIVDSDFSSISVIIRYPGKQDKGNSPVFSFYKALDKALFKVSKNYSSAVNIQKLVQGIFALVVRTEVWIFSACPADGVNFVDKNDAGRFFLCLLK